MKFLTGLIFLILVQTVFCQSEPDWITRYPFSQEHYTGIGSSNTGDRSEDYEIALERARVNLASEISTEIVAETTIYTRDTSTGEFSEEFQEELNQTVHHNLKNLEIVDTWHSSDKGYWVYVRLNKKIWQDDQKKEAFELMSRLQNIFDEEYFSRSITSANRLLKLGNGSSILESTSQKYHLSGELAERYTGNIYDFVSSEIFRHSSAITISSDSNKYRINDGDILQLTIRCSSDDYFTGKLPLIIKNAENEYIGISTDVNGLCLLAVPSQFLPHDKNELLISIDLQKLGFPEQSEMSNRVANTGYGIHIEKSLPLLSLDFESNRDQINLQSQQIRSVLSRYDSDYIITENDEISQFNLIITYEFSDLPRALPNSPLMAGLNTHLSLMKDRNILFQYSLPYFKEGGLSYEQAYERVIRKMLRQFPSEERLFQGLIESLE